MNKTELVNSVAEKADITKKDAEKAVKAVFEAISESLQKDDKVQIIGFGTFEVRHRKEREGRNPQTKETIKIAASRNGSFLFLHFVVPWIYNLVRPAV